MASLLLWIQDIFSLPPPSSTVTLTLDGVVQTVQQTSPGAYIVTQIPGDRPLTGVFDIQFPGFKSVQQGFVLRPATAGLECELTQPVNPACAVEASASGALGLRIHALRIVEKTHEFRAAFPNDPVPSRVEQDLIPQFPQRILAEPGSPDIVTVALQHACCRGTFLFFVRETGGFVLRNIHAVQEPATNTPTRLVPNIAPSPRGVAVWVPDGLLEKLDAASDHDVQTPADCVMDSDIVVTTLPVTTGYVAATSLARISIKNTTEGKSTRAYFHQ